MRAAALTGMHAISGADVTGSFSGKAEASFWNRFLDSPVEVLQVLGAMGEANDVPDEHYTVSEQFICSVYQQPRPNATFLKLADLRWWLYCKKQAQGASLPPTAASLRPAIQRCHYQCIEWCRDIHCHPQLPAPSGYGWVLESGKYEPVRPAMCTRRCTGCYQMLLQVR